MVFVVDSCLQATNADFCNIEVRSLGNLEVVSVFTQMALIFTEEEIVNKIKEENKVQDKPSI